MQVKQASHINRCRAEKKLLEHIKSAALLLVANSKQNFSGKFEIDKKIQSAFEYWQ